MLQSSFFRNSQPTVSKQRATAVAKLFKNKGKNHNEKPRVKWRSLRTLRGTMTPKERFTRNLKNIGKK